MGKDIALSSLEHYYLNSKTKIIMQRKATYNHQTSQFWYTVTPIFNETKYLRIVNRERRVLLFKAISQKLALRPDKNIVFSFHPENGQVKIILFNGALIASNKIDEAIHWMLDKYYNFDYLKDFLLYTLAGMYVHTDVISS